MTRKFRRCAGAVSAGTRTGGPKPRTRSCAGTIWSSAISPRLGRPHPAAGGGDGGSAARRGHAAPVPGQLAVRAVRDLSLGGAAGGDRRRVPARLDAGVAARAGACRSAKRPSWSLAAASPSAVLHCRRAADQESLRLPPARRLGLQLAAGLGPPSRHRCAGRALCPACRRGGARQRRRRSPDRRPQHRHDDRGRGGRPRAARSIPSSAAAARRWRC